MAVLWGGILLLIEKILVGVESSVSQTLSANSSQNSNQHVFNSTSNLAGSSILICRLHVGSLVTSPWVTEAPPHKVRTWKHWVSDHWRYLVLRSECTRHQDQRALYYCNSLPGVTSLTTSSGESQGQGYVTRVSSKRAEQVAKTFLQSILSIKTRIALSLVLWRIEPMIADMLELLKPSGQVPVTWSNSHWNFRNPPSLLSTTTRPTYSEWVFK